MAKKNKEMQDIEIRCVSLTKFKKDGPELEKLLSACCDTWRDIPAGLKIGRGFAARAPDEFNSDDRKILRAWPAGALRVVRGAAIQLLCCDELPAYVRVRARRGDAASVELRMAQKGKKNRPRMELTVTFVHPDFSSG